MTFTHALATNNYGEAKFIVTASAANGTHTTIAAAIAAAVSGETIFIRTGTYTENLTLKAGVNLVAWEPDGYSANVNIVGNCTHNTAGFVICAGIRFTTNNAAAITVSGSVGSKLRLVNCYISAANSTAIIYSSSSVDSSIQIFNCEGNTGTTGVGIYTHTAAGQLAFAYCLFTNTGGSSTASDTTGGVGITYTSFSQPLSTSSAGSYNISNSNFNTSTQNVTAFTTAGTGTSFAEYSDFVAGTASAVSIGAGTTFNVIGPCGINSSNTNAVTGAGTLRLGTLLFAGSSSLINTTTVTSYQTSNGISRSTLQPAFLATHSVAQNNITGNSTEVTPNFTTEVFDQNNNYDGTNLFTAPITGRYQFNASLFINDASTSTSGYLYVNASNRAMIGASQGPFPLGSASTYQLFMSCLVDMDAGDTANCRCSVGGMAGATADFPASVTNSWFSGFLVC
jgi:hypothetical protein